MIDCDQFNRALPYLIADEVEPGSRAELLAHAELCDVCGAELRIDRSLRQGLHETSLQQAPVCPPRVRATIERSFRRRRLARTSAGLGGLAAAAALGLFMLQPTGDPLDPLVDTTIDYQARRLPADVAFEPPAQVEAFLTEQLGRRELAAHRPAPRARARFMPTQEGEVP